MSFSEKMRESLGAEGVRLELPTPSDPLPPGASYQTQLSLLGGTRDARINSLVIRVVEADRHWLTADGDRLTEDEAQALEDRRHLTAGWDRRTVGEQRIDLDVEIGASGREQVELTVEIPEACQATAINCAHTLNIQADIKGQIDPTQNARIVVASG